MKKLFFILSIIPLLSGCIMTVEHPDDIVQIPPYDEDAIIEYIQFYLPFKPSSEVNISLELYRPDDSSNGIYSKTVVERECRVPIGRTQLYYPGLWKIEYEIGESITGNKYFWVESKEHELDRYIVENYIDSGSTISFDVYNSGKESGWVSIVAIATTPLTIGGNTVYDKTFIDTEEYLRPGHRNSLTTTITQTNQITIILNGEEFHYG